MTMIDTDSTADVASLVGTIADTLGERSPLARKQIADILDTIGPAATQALVAEAQRVDAEGGMLTDDGSRRRTLGGVFFKLAKNTLAPTDRRLIFVQPRVTVQRIKQLPSGKRIFKDRTGEIQAMNLTITGRPTRVEDRTSYLVATLQDTTVPTVPMGLPAPPTEPTIYSVLLSRRQWDRVAPQLKDRAMALQIDGAPKIDARFGEGIVVYAQAVRCVPATEGMD